MWCHCHFPIYGQFEVIQQPNTRCIVCKTYIFIKSNLLSYKNWKQNYIFAKNADISKVRRALILKGYFKFQVFHIVLTSFKTGVILLSQHFKTNPPKKPTQNRVKVTFLNENGKVTSDRISFFFFNFSIPGWFFIFFIEFNTGSWWRVTFGGCWTSKFERTFEKY